MNSIFEIVGPVMVGPSSSHTAGAAKMAKMARKILADIPKKAEIFLYGSFSKTYVGHGTDRALIAGLLGLDEDDERLPESFKLAESAKLEYLFIPSDEEVAHPNTVKFKLTGETGKKVVVKAVSLGGGLIRIDEIDGVSVSNADEQLTAKAKVPNHGMYRVLTFSNI